MTNVCQNCKAQVKEWNERCGGCGFTLVLEPDALVRARYLRGPSLGALLFTQGWTIGAHLYLWFLVSLIPVVGLIVPFVMVIFGRRLAWKAGGWSDWRAFQSRMLLLDILGAIWVIGLIAIWFFFHQRSGS